MSDPAFKRTLRWLTLTTWFVYALTSVGTLSADPYTRFDVAESLLRDGDVTLHAKLDLTVEHHGQYYSVFFPGQSILFLPPAALSVVANRLLGVGPELSTISARFIAGVFLMSSFGALCLLGHVTLLRLLRVGPRLALASGLVLAFGTPLWVWGSNASEETTLAALAVWSFWALLDARRIAQAAGKSEVHPPDLPARFVNRLGLAAVLLACGFIHRATFVAVIAGAAVIALPLLLQHLAWLGRTKARFAAWALAALAILAIVPLYNYIRFGNALDTGYARFYESVGGVFANPLPTGLIGHLFSPGKSVFLYAPWLILLPVALLVPAVYRRLGLFAPALLLTIAIHLLIYSLHTYWAGAFGWAVRFHASLMPLLLVPIAVLIGLTPRTRARSALLATLAALSFIIQLAGNSLNTGLEHLQHPENYTGPGRLIPADAAWTWDGSQLRLRFINIAHKLQGRRLLDLPETDRHYIREVWNIFPLRAAAAIEARWVILTVWLLWLTLLALAYVSARLTFESWQRLRPPPSAPDPII